MTDTKPDTARSLGVLVQELMGLVHRRFAGDAMQIMAESGLTMPQIVALHVLRFGPPCHIGALGEHLKLSTSATSHMVERLFEKGLVDRTEDPIDRRQKNVAITAEGIALVVRLHTERTQELSRALSTLDPELREQLVSVFERVIAQLRAGDPTLARDRN